MTESWANPGRDLHLELAGGRGRAALERALRSAVQGGRLAPGTRLPSSRVLAADLGVARNTVADAYGQLVAEGWLVAVTGSGTRVADRAPDAVPPPLAVEGPAPVRYRLAAGYPDVSAFPRTAWLASARRALSGAPAAAFGYGDPRGQPVLRRALAGYLTRARGVRADAGRIVVTTGYTQSLALLAGVLRQRGATAAAMEEYGHRSQRTLVERAGLVVRDVPVDAHGAVVPAFGDAAAVTLTPAHQFPIGVPLSAARRTAAVDWAARTGGYVMEDDYDGEFRYDRQAIGAMQARSPGRVVYAGTASKTLAPGLRLGWLVVPDDLLDEVVAAKEAADWQTNTLDQLTLADFIETGAYDRQVRRMRLTYRRRRDMLVSVLAERAPRVRVAGIAAGLQAVVELPHGTDPAAVVARAGERGLAIEPLSRYGPPAPALVIGFATPPPHLYTAALARLAAVL